MGTGDADSVENGVAHCGVLTLCHQSDWHKAIGLSLSIRARSPSVQLAVVAHQSLWQRLAGHFDILIPENDSLDGFEHKLHLDNYTPFQNTLFIDADIIVLIDIRTLFKKWGGREFIARGGMVEGGRSNFGLERGEVLRRTGKSCFVSFDGAGHYYFEKPGSSLVFQRAREIAKYKDVLLPGAGKIADEDVFGVVATELGIDPYRSKMIVGFVRAVDRWLEKLSVVEGRCRYVDLQGDIVNPAFLHFPRDMSPLLYHRLLRELSRAATTPVRVNWIWFGLKEWADVVARYGILYKISPSLRDAIRFIWHRVRR